MATYCMSDIHGDYESFMEMLQLIKFSSTDTLYVLGDVIDRHPGVVDILLDIMERPNVHMILGNHEDMCYKGVVKKDRDSWSDWIQNGGDCTRSALFYKDTAKYRDKIMAFIRDLPTYIELEVEGKSFYLVHAAPADNDHDRIWWRFDEKAPPFLPEATVIVGHTPTPFLNGGFFEPFVIWHGDGIIDIDCGCGSNFEHRQLGCLRLETENGTAFDQGLWGYC